MSTAAGHALYACSLLICLFPADRSGPSAAERLAEVTGLSVERAMRGDAPLTKEDLAELTAEQQQMLAPHLGKPVCGLAQAVGLTGLGADGTSPPSHSCPCRPPAWPSAA